MKKAAALCIIILLCLGLAGCGDGADRSTDDAPDVGDNNSIVDFKNKIPGKESGGGDPVVRSDAENLMQVRIENGEATVYFNAERFNELYGASGIHRGAFEVTGLSGRVRDVCIAQIPELDYWNSTDFTLPIIFFLMEDGSVEWTLADMYPHDVQSPELYSQGALMWIENIVSLSCESDGEGLGGVTVYAQDSKGVRYDLRIATKFKELNHAFWVADLYQAEDGDFSTYYGVLQFSEDGSVRFQKGWFDDDPLTYTGTYVLSVAEDAEQRPGILSLDLYLEDSGNTQNAKRELHSQFFADMQGTVMLELWLADGDALHTDRNVRVEYGTFWFGYSPFEKMIHQEFPDEYLISTVEKARGLVTEYGMSILVTDEYVELSEGYCREIWLGTDHAGQFVREILYAISDYGNIYEYDPVGDSWILVG